MDKNLLTLGINEQNTISHISDCILTQYKTNSGEAAHTMINEILSLIDDVNVPGETLAKVENYKNSLLKTRLELSKDCVLFDKFLEMNRINRDIISNDIEILNNSLKDVSSSREDSYDIKAIQRRIEDLTLTNSVSSQLEVQLQLLSDGNRKTISLIENTVFTTVTLWKNRLFLEKQKSQL